MCVSYILSMKPHALYGFGILQKTAPSIMCIFNITKYGDNHFISQYPWITAMNGTFHSHISHTHI